MFYQDSEPWAAAAAAAAAVAGACRLDLEVDRDSERGHRGCRIRGAADGSRGCRIGRLAAVPSLCSMLALLRS